MDEKQLHALAIYTTNAIESLNSMIRHAIKKRKEFPTNGSVKNIVCLDKLQDRDFRARRC